MRKILTPDSWEFSDQPCRILPVRTGKVPLGSNDKRILAKIADEGLLSKIASLHKQPGEELIHMLAVGSTERFGPNRNGDGFREAICQRYHPSFVKCAMFYRNHQSQNPRISYGVVKLSHFNPRMSRIELVAALNADAEAARRNGGLVADIEMNKLAGGQDIPVSMGCTTDPDTLVCTSTGYKRIADIVVGDLVCTHAGNWRRVTEVMQRPYTGEITTFNVEGLPFSVSLTADHPLFSKILAGYPAMAAKHRPAGQWENEIAAGKPAFSWVHAEHLARHDRIAYVPATPVPGVPGVHDIDLAGLLGIYTAEGNIAFSNDNPTTVQLTIHEDDWARKAVPDMIGRLWPGVTVTLEPKRNCKVSFALSIHSAELARWLLDLVGHGAENKRIPPEILAGTPEAKLEYLGRWLDGDGWCDKKGLHWSSCNAGLILQGRDLLSSLGISASVYRIPAQKRTSGFGRPNPEYTLNVSNFDGAPLLPHSQKVAETPWPQGGKRSKPPALRRLASGNCAYRIKSVARKTVEAVTVYNFEVEGDHSYSMYGLASHNCRVSHDICSYCGNHAATRAEYCDEGMCKAGGLKRNMGRLLASGDVLHADNPDPNFNDISHIVAGRQADRIAYVTGVLQKQASDSGRIVSGAELAELYGPEQAANRWSDLAADVAYWEDRANQKIAATLPYEELRLPEFPLVKLSQMTAALADRSVILSAAEFAKVLAAGNPVPEVQIKQAAQGVFSRLACPDDNPYEHRGPIDSRYLKWAADVEATHSLKEEVLWKRAAFRSALDVPQQLLPNTKQAGTAKLAEELAQQYGLYVLASIDRMRARNRNLQLTATAAILQNRIC